MFKNIPIGSCHVYYGLLSVELTLNTFVGLLEEIDRDNCWDEASTRCMFNRKFEQLLSRDESQLETDAGDSLKHVLSELESLVAVSRITDCILVDSCLLITLE